ncbi:hypothetical protein Syncc8109_0590 [Synechococcus sp. WH 8109]|nr:hypothetical protein Syncc8109_0590 [Synechococcus sp. WH 8109]
MGAMPLDTPGGSITRLDRAKHFRSLGEFTTTQKTKGFRQ